MICHKIVATRGCKTREVIQMCSKTQKFFFFFLISIWLDYTSSFWMSNITKCVSPFYFHLVFSWIELVVLESPQAKQFKVASWFSVGKIIYQSGIFSFKDGRNKKILQNWNRGTIILLVFWHSCFSGPHLSKYCSVYNCLTVL